MPDRFDWMQFVALLLLIGTLVFIMFAGHMLRWS